jgi:hypothetical protein
MVPAGLNRSIWVDVRKSKERLQLFNGSATVDVNPVHLTVALIRITATVSYRSQDKTCLFERAEPAFGGSSTSGNHAISFYRIERFPRHWHRWVSFGKQTRASLASAQELFRDSGPAAVRAANGRDVKPRPALCESAQVLCAPGQISPLCTRA